MCDIQGLVKCEHSSAGKKQGTGGAWWQVGGNPLAVSDASTEVRSVGRFTRMLEGRCSAVEPFHDSVGHRVGEDPVSRVVAMAISDE